MFFLIYGRASIALWIRCNMCWNFFVCYVYSLDLIRYSFFFYLAIPLLKELNFLFFYLLSDTSSFWIFLSSTNYHILLHASTGYYRLPSPPFFRIHVLFMTLFTMVFFLLCGSPLQILLHCLSTVLVLTLLLASSRSRSTTCLA